MILTFQQLNDLIGEKTPDARRCIASHVREAAARDGIDLKLPCPICNGDEPRTCRRHGWHTCTCREPDFSCRCIDGTASLLLDVIDGVSDVHEWQMWIDAGCGCADEDDAKEAAE